MGIGLTLEEYVDLQVRARVGADRAFHVAAAMERKEMFPMNTMVASSHLRQKGHACRPQMLDMLVEDGVIKLAKPDAWTQADVDAAAEHFEDGNILTPYAAMCETLGCRYADSERRMVSGSDFQRKRLRRPTRFCRKKVDPSAPGSSSPRT